MFTVEDGRILTLDNNAYNILNYLPSGVLLDVGAAAGHITNLMLKLSPQSEVIAFEPFPGNWPYINQYCGTDSRITIRPVAVGEYSGLSSFKCGKTVTGSEPGWEKRIGYSSGGYLAEEANTINPEDSIIQVECVRLDDEVIGSPMFLKIDVQGGELGVLKGAKRLISDGLPVIYCEYSGQEGVLEFLFEHNYVVFDQEYLIVPRTADDTLDDWDIHHEKFLSSGRKSFLGWPKSRPKESKQFKEFMRSQRPKRMVAQLDLLCIHRDFFAEKIDFLIKQEHKKNYEHYVEKRIDNIVKNEKNITIFINLSAINFSATLGVWLFGTNLLKALYNQKTLSLVGVCHPSNTLPKQHYSFFDNVIQAGSVSYDKDGIELLLHHFQEPMTGLPYVMIFFDLHLWDVPWKYGKPHEQMQKVGKIVSNATAITTMFPRTYFDLPKVIEHVPNPCFLTISPTLQNPIPTHADEVDLICGNLGIDKEKKVILYPAQYQEHKNHLSLFKAIKMLDDNSICLVCTGSTFKNKHTNLLNDAISELNLQKQIIMTGHLSNTDLAKLFHRAELIISSSLAEGGAYIVQEAISYKKNIVISNLRSAVMHLKLMNADIPTFDPLNISDTAATIHKSLSQPQDNEFAYNIISSWTWEKLASEYTNIFNWVANDCPSGEMPAFANMSTGIALSVGNN